MIGGTVEKVGNMPDRTVYTITEKGEKEFRDTLRKSILQFDYDTNVFSIAGFFIDVFNKQEKVELLEKRLEILEKYLDGIKKQITFKWKNEVMPTHTANVERMVCIVNAEVSGTKKLLDACKEDMK